MFPTVSFYGPISRILETFPPKPYENKSEKAMLGTHCTNIKSPSCGPSTRCLSHDRGQRVDNYRRRVTGYFLTEPWGTVPTTPFSIREEPPEDRRDALAPISEKTV